MNIDELTIGQIREIAAAFPALFVPSQTPPAVHPMVGKYAICRCYSAGVHAGEVVSVDGDRVILRNSRRLWSWTANTGIALSGVAQHGIYISKSKVDTINPEIYLTGVIEIIPATEAARESINGSK